MGRVSGESTVTIFMTQIFKSFRAAANLQSRPEVRTKQNGKKTLIQSATIHIQPHLQLNISLIHGHWQGQEQK